MLSTPYFIFVFFSKLSSFLIGEESCFFSVMMKRMDAENGANGYALRLEGTSIHPSFIEFSWGVILTPSDLKLAKLPSTVK